MNRPAIYTAIFGGFDTLREQPTQPGFDMVCFTDDPTLTSNQWRVVHAKSRGDRPRMSAKWFKAHPHKALPRHSRTVWVDAGVQIQREDFAATVLDASRSSGLSLIQHPTRDAVRAEALFCLDLPKYQGQPMLEQVDHYRHRKGFPDTSGLWAGGVMGRDNRRVIRRLSNQWWRENRRWTYQDQLSLPYLLWKFDVQPGAVPFDLLDEEMLRMVEHASDL